MLCFLWQCYVIRCGALYAALSCLLVQKEQFARLPVPVQTILGRDVQRDLRFALYVDKCGLVEVDFPWSLVGKRITQHLLISDGRQLAML